MKPLIITTAALRRYSACEPAMIFFRSVFGKSATLNATNISLAARRFNPVQGHRAGWVLTLASYYLSGHGARRFDELMRPFVYGGHKQYAAVCRRNDALVNGITGLAFQPDTRYRAKCVQQVVREHFAACIDAERRHFTLGLQTLCDIWHASERYRRKAKK